MNNSTNRFNWIHSIKFILIFFVLCLSISIVEASPQNLNGTWYSVHSYAESGPKEDFLDSPLQEKNLQVVESIAKTGGHFVYIAHFKISNSDEFVIDFKNTSTIAQFRHRIYNQQNQLLATLDGGIENETLNPFFLRHGREIHLEKGDYQLVTELISSSFLAIPEPYIDDRSHYQQAIKYSTTLTLISLGIFFGLGIYYAVLASIRNRLAEGMYASFILGNFLFNSATLLVLADVFAVHSLYWGTFPILFSNIAYVVFVMALLEIKPETKKRLYWAGVALFSLMCLFVGLAIVYPNWALELSRFGVGMFLFYGLTAAIIESLRHNASAKRYLIAISIFFVLGLITITLSKIDNQYTFYIEHMGLISVSIEVIFLALVLSFQFSQLQSEKDQALQELALSMTTAHSDALTGLPNRHALVKAVVNLPSYGSLTFIDLDGLKFYNDMYGHSRGDKLLTSFGECYQKSLGDGLKLYRLGGDEFAVISQNGDLIKIEIALSEALHSMRLAGFEFAGASAGSVYGYEAENITSLIHLADERMYENKRLRKLARADNLQEQFEFSQPDDVI
ncbi:MAG TPA: diguanylate cyclase [Methylotenera sp.]|nr:diguanylate cyclase [Methylotenera sp.]